jgi:diaminopimelate epimerase
LVALRESVDTFDLEQARALRRKFDANVNIAAIADGGLRVRTYERGVENETLACGTGMAACFYRANREGKVGERAEAVPTGGEAVVLARRGETLSLEGPVRRTFDAIVK